MAFLIGYVLGRVGFEEHFEVEGRTQLAGVVEVTLAVQRRPHHGEERNEGSCAVQHVESGRLDLYC